jgi:hypothetical protein
MSCRAMFLTTCYWIRRMCYRSPRWAMLPNAVFIAALASACWGGKGDSGSKAPSQSAGGAAGDAAASDPCARMSAWGRPFCCGRQGELVGLSCVDEAAPAPCTQAGNVLDARIAQQHCCEGLHPIDTTIETDVAELDYPPGCGAGPQPPSMFYCAACGNATCEAPYENRCNCPRDCSD